MYKKFKLDFFGGFYVFVSDDMESAFNDAKKKLGFNFEYEDEIALTVSTNHGVAMLFEKSVTDSIVVHECVHCAWHLLTSFGVEFDTDHHEIYALSVELLYEKTMKFINENRSNR